MEERQKIYYKEHYERCKVAIGTRDRIKRENNLPHFMVKNAQQRAKRKGWDFNLTPEDVVIPEICPVFHQPFKIGTIYAASIDRIESSYGYIKDNIQVISHKANTMKQNATPEELLMFADWIYKTYGNAKEAGDYNFETGEVKLWTPTDSST